LPTTLERLVYVSCGAPGSLTLAGVSVILGEACRNNERRGVTGALAVGEKAFFQVIEGQRDVLDLLLEKLRQDRRHHGLRVLDRRPITHRQFEGWAMKGPLNAPDIQRFVAQVADDRISPKDAVTTLELLL
jgi:hypothetical protein